MPEWITVREAAEILGVHMSAVPKMVRRGDLTPRTRRPRLERAQILELAEMRALAAQEREQQRAATAGPRPPDDEHDWLLAPAAAAVLGCTEVALSKIRIRTTSLRC